VIEDSCPEGESNSYYEKKTQKMVNEFLIAEENMPS
jgi:hypothetical protein